MKTLSPRVFGARLALLLIAVFAPAAAPDSRPAVVASARAALADGRLALAESLAVAAIEPDRPGARRDVDEALEIGVRAALGIETAGRGAWPARAARLADDRAADHRASAALRLDALELLGRSWLQGSAPARADSVFLELRGRALGAAPPDSNRLGRVLVLRSAALVSADSLARGLDTLVAACAVLERFPGRDSVDLVLAYARRCEQLHRALRPGEGIAWGERALAIAERRLGERDPVRLTAIEVLGYASGLSQARVQEGQALLQRALALARETCGPRADRTATLLEKLALVEQLRPDQAAARRHLEESIAILEARGIAADSRLRGVRRSYATLLDRSGEPRAAHAQFERLLEALPATDPALRGERMRTLNDFGASLRRASEYERALGLFTEALQIGEALYGPDSQVLRLLLQNLGDDEVELQRYAEARLHYARVAARLDAIGRLDSGEAMTLWQSLAFVERHDGNWAAAESCATRSIAIRERTLGPEHPRIAGSLIDRARVRAARGDARAALDDALRAESLTREQFRRDARVLSEPAAMRRAADRLTTLETYLTLAPQLEPEGRARAYDALIRGRGLVLDEMTWRRAWQPPGDTTRVRLAAELDGARADLSRLLVRGPGPEALPAFAARVREARDRVAEAERRVAVRSESFAREHARTTAGIREVAAALGRRGALVSYARFHRDEGRELGAEHYVAFVLREGDAAPAVRDLGEAAPIDEAIERWRARLATPPSPAREAAAAGEAACRDAGLDVRRRIWDPVAPLLAGAGSVTIVADGALHRVAFGALPRPRGGYLVEDEAPVQIAVAERELVPGGTTPVASGAPLALGGPDFDRAASAAAPAGELIAYRGGRSDCMRGALGRFAPLPGATAEANDVAARLRADADGADVLVLTGENATEAAFKRLAHGRRRLHLATHGFVLGDRCESAPSGTRGIGGMAATEPVAAPATSPDENPLLRLGLALAGANAADRAAPGEEDGVLTADEIASLDLRGAETVVLSACESAAGPIASGEGVFGLARAFRVAGARTVVASLWAVEDVATRDWMREFYANLARGAAPAAAARSAAVRELSERRARGLDTHPFRWAGFVVSGGGR